MKNKKDSSTNQVKPHQLVVNGRELSEEELSEISECEVPPKKLKPGKYWYDKYSGFWGKEGKKPEYMITPKLNVGGVLRADASNGNTIVFINGREITKIELWVLKLTKVQCYGDMHLWVYKDGSCEDSDQRIKENIWGKASTRFICSLFSFPVPPCNNGASSMGNPLLL